mgnify:CR=1 FL=1
MTKYQRKVCKYISKYKKLNVILKKSKINDYLELQYKFDKYKLDFSDDKMDDKTEVYLPDDLIEEMEKYHAYFVDVIITRIVAIWGGITGTVAIIVEIMQLFQLLQKQ